MNNTVQIKGPFIKGEELIRGKNYKNIRKISILTQPNQYIHINDMLFEIGKTGILEIEGTDISQLSFEEEQNENTFIDFIMS